MKEQNLNIRYMVVQLSELSQQEQELVNRRMPPSRRDSVPSAAPSSVPRATIPTSLS